MDTALNVVSTCCGLGLWLGHAGSIVPELRTRQEIGRCRGVPQGREI